MPRPFAGLLIFLGGAAAGTCIPAPGQDAVYRSGIREVQVHVVAQDGRGNSVSDLSQAEFRLLEDGRPQRIIYFSVHRRARPQSEAPSRLAANTFSNRLAHKVGLPRGVTAILIDAYNSSFTDQHYAMRGAARVLREIPMDERVGVYRLSRAGIQVLHDFTTDTASLVRRLAQTKGLASIPDDVQATGAPLVEPTALGDVQGNGVLERRVRLLHTLGAMRAIAEHLSQLPGRKSLLWLTSGFPMKNVTDNLRDWRRAMKELNDANVAVYAIDGSGLRVQAGYSASQPTTRSLPQPRATRVNANNDVLKLAADQTGGRAYENSNDLAKAIREALDDSEVVYTLGYSPDHAEWDGEFRRIRVEVERKGVRLRHRDGYFARERAEYDVTEREEALRLATISPLEASGIGLAVQVRSDVSDEGIRAELTIVGSPEALVLRSEEGRWKGGFDVRFVQRSAEGAEIESFTNEVTLNMKEGRYQRMLREGFVVTEAVTVDRAAGELRISVCDHLSGAVGSVFVPLSAVEGIGSN